MQPAFLIDFLFSTATDIENPLIPHCDLIPMNLFDVSWINNYAAIDQKTAMAG